MTVGSGLAGCVQAQPQRRSEPLGAPPFCDTSVNRRGGGPSVVGPPAVRSRISRVMPGAAKLRMGAQFSKCAWRNAALNLSAGETSQLASFGVERTLPISIVSRYPFELELRPFRQFRRPVTTFYVGTIIRKMARLGTSEAFR